MQTVTLVMMAQACTDLHLHLYVQPDKLVMHLMVCAGSLSHQQRRRRVHGVCHASVDSIIANFNHEATKQRLEFLEKQAIKALHTAAEQFKRPTFPCALIAGDVVILHLLHKEGLLDKGVHSCFVPGSTVEAGCHMVAKLYMVWSLKRL
jgi:hypothetical protein